MDYFDYQLANIRGGMANKMIAGSIYETSWQCILCWRVDKLLETAKSKLLNCGKTSS